MLDRLFLQTEHGPHMECLPSVELSPELEGLVYMSSVIFGSFGSGWCQQRDPTGEP
jgi:hypothetical protein